MGDDLRCSRCPLLDLGVQYPVGDERDPWRRLPAHFQQLKSILGNSAMNHKSPLRLRTEKLLAFYCGRQREAHGKCNNERVRLCSGITLAALADASKAPSKAERIAHLQAGLRRTINSDDTHRRLKATRQKSSDPAVTMPPLFKEVPEA